MLGLYKKSQKCVDLEIIAKNWVLVGLNVGTFNQIVFHSNSW